MTKQISLTLPLVLLDQRLARSLYSRAHNAISIEGARKLDETTTLKVERLILDLEAVAQLYNYGSLS